MKTTIKIEYNGTELMVEVTKEVNEFLAESQKEIENSDRQARRNSKHFSLAAWHKMNLCASVGAEEEFFNYHEKLQAEESEYSQYQKIFKVLETCTQKQRERFILRHVHGYSLRHIALLQDCDHSSVRESCNAVKRKIVKAFRK